MATVYRADDPDEDRDLAIKVLRREYLNDLGSRARFEREAETVATLEHPAIVPLYEFGQSEGALYIVMPYMPNHSLADRLARGPLAVEEAAPIVARVAAALDYAHDRDVIHRDLKPSNILFDAQGRAYLADFGIALQPRASGRGTVVVSGTPAYMSPEQARQDRDIDGRSDLYSLGITLFEALTGQLPFEGDSPVTILLKHQHDRPTSVLVARPDLPPTLEPFFAQALAKEPAERYQTGADLAEAFYLACGLERPGEDSTAAGPASAAGEGQPAPDSVTARATRETPQIIPPWLQHLEPESETALAAAAREPEAISARLVRWLGERPFVALALVSLLGILSAAIVVGAIRAPAMLSAREATPIVATETPAAAKTNMTLVYTARTVTIVNTSKWPLSLADVTFERPVAGGQEAASFSAGRWAKGAGRPNGTLPGSACLQLLRPGGAIPASPPKPLPPPNCKAQQSWLMAEEQEWAFWTPEGGGDVFQVLKGGETIETCYYNQGLCKFTLPAS
jgi:hypothetical protein